MSRRVLVTGSRYWSNRATIRRALDAEYLALEDGHLTVVHGGCAIGAEAYTAEWCRHNADLAVVEESHAARWDTRDKETRPIRNAHMVSLGADIVLAFLQPGATNNGTRNCIRLAERAGLTVRTYPEGN